MFLYNKDELFYKKDEEDEFYPGWESSFVSKDEMLTIKSALRRSCPSLLLIVMIFGFHFIISTQKHLI